MGEVWTTSVPKLRSVRFHNGGCIIPLENRMAGTSERVLAAARYDLNEIEVDQEGKAAGCAVIVWGADGRVSAAVTITDYSPYVSDHIPTLAADAIRRVANKMQINRMLGRDDNG